ncbi:MAG TPA: hypothetical protein VK176_11530 [Phycisphaerales bacterium]|nr:hypothetical protein [Phycisphaerales bacterium]
MESAQGAMDDPAAEPIAGAATEPARIRDQDPLALFIALRTTLPAVMPTGVPPGTALVRPGIPPHFRGCWRRRSRSAPNF